VTLSTITHPPYYIAGWILSRLLLPFTLSKADISKNEKLNENYINNNIATF
jgi:hypothetical protein